MNDAPVWVFRTYEARRNWVWKEIREGRLRQGWGCEGAALTENGTALRRAEWIQRYSAGIRKHWRSGEGYIQEAKTRHAILFRMLEMARGDLVLVPHMPEETSFTLLRVAGPYRFDQALLEEEGHSDLGHIIPVESHRLEVRHDSRPEAIRIASDLRPWRKAVNRVRHPEMAAAIREIEPLLSL